MRTRRTGSAAAVLLLAALLTVLFGSVLTAFADDHAGDPGEIIALGGGYAATGQTGNAGYTSALYDASNGLITSDANYVLCASNGYVWIGGYAGIIRYDGSAFTLLDTSDGLTSGRGLYEDSRNRIWVGTNDNGVVVIDGDQRTHFTYQEGMPASSIRSFAEDADGNVFIGTTGGVCYVDQNNTLTVISDERLAGERVLRLDADPEGRIYGQTKKGAVFRIEEQQVTAFYESKELDIGKITTIMADPLHSGNVYLGTDSGVVYSGAFGSKAGEMKRISVSPLSDIHWISYDCGRIWVSSTTALGYLDEKEKFRILEDLPVTSGIEMTTSDYQGNLWLASSRQGVMKLTASSFVDVTGRAGLSAGVTNAVCLHHDDLYIGTDSGLYILDQNGRQIENTLTDYIGDSRIRCLGSGTDGDLWIGVFTNGLGLLRVSENGRITAFTKENGMPSDEIRCVSFMQNGTVLAGTNNGLAVLRNGKILQTVGPDDVSNTVFLDVEEGENGQILVGTDGDGIYVIDGTEIRRIGRDDGLTSDVIMRIKHDEARNLYWIVTSNSIEYMRDDEITCITTFPYTNNYDLFSDESGHIWVIASCGIYMADAADMLQDQVKDPRLFTTANGLTSLPSSYAFCARRDDGMLFIPSKNGVCSVNIDHFAEGDAPVKAALSSVCFGENEILPDENGRYIIPAKSGRIRITASVMDYTLMDPQVEVFFEGKETDGINTSLSSLTPLEYTELEYGDHILHIRVTDTLSNTALLDKMFHIEKKPRVTELPAFALTVVLLAAALAGVIVWRVTRSYLMRRQNEELRRAKNEAELANTTRSRFLDNMSHEILNPVNTIVGINEMTMREDTAGVPAGYSAAVRNYALDIRNASESLMYLIRDLLDMTAVESSSVHLVSQEYDTKEILREITNAVGIRCQEKGLRFEVTAEEILPRRMYGDIGKIRQILLKLLTNAVTYTDTGSISFCVALEERIDNKCRLCFTITDTGRGFTQTEWNSMQTIYKRMGEEENRDALGTQLGLSLAQRFAELLGGTLTFESELGKGTEAVLSLTQQIVDKTPIGKFAGFSMDAVSGSYVPLFRAPDADVLVVSSDAMTIKVIKGLLKGTEVFVTTAGTPGACLDKMAGTNFHVILIDMMLRGIDANFLAKLHEKDPTLPVYAITANVTEDEEQYHAEGYAGYLTKPIDGTSLERTIMKHLPEDIMEKSEDLFSRR